MKYFAPRCIGNNTLTYRNLIKDIYSEEFLEQIYRCLKITEHKKREDFKRYIIDTSTSYLTAKDINSGRITPRQQKKIFQKYETALRETKKYYLEINQHGSTSSNFHASLENEVRDLDNTVTKQMFSPYVLFDEDKNNPTGVSAGISGGIFENFLDTLINVAKNSPAYITKNNKANMDKDYILWWLYRMGEGWEYFSDVGFSLGDWFKNEELGEKDIDNPDKKGRYKSICLEVLYDLLKAVDKEITRSDIETAMRKYKKL